MTAGYDVMYIYLKDVNRNAVIEHQDVNTCWANLEEKLKEATDKCVYSF